MAGAVHLNAAHFYPFIKRINVLEIVKAGARYFSALPLSGKLPFKPRRGLILKGGKAYDVQRLSGRDAIAGGGRFCHGVLHAKAPQQFPHVLGQTFDGGHIGALRPHRADKAVRVHEPLQQRPALFGGSAFILGRDAFLAETGQKDGLERRDSEYPAPAAALFPFAGDLIGKLLQEVLHIAGAHGDLRLDGIAVSQPETVDIGIDRKLPFRHLQRSGDGDADH